MPPIVYNYDTDSDKFISHHWVQSRTGDGFQLIVLTGVVGIHQKGESEDRWKREKINFLIPIPHIPRDKYFKLKNWAPFVTINAVYNENVSNNSGHAVDAFRILHPRSSTSRLITVQADIAIHDSDAWIFRIGYNVTLVGEYVDPPQME